MTHLTREELERWWAHGDDAERARIVGHLAICDHCAALYGEVIDSYPPESEAATPLAAVVPSGYRAYRSAHPWRNAFRGQPAYAALAGLAAALVLAIVLVPALLVPQQEIPDDPGIRGTDIQLLSPAGSVTGPVEFRWVSPLRAPSFRVDILGTDQQPVLTVATSEERVSLSSAELARLQPGATYSWRVTALDAAGEPITQSAPRAFVLNPQ